jgi:phosphoserine phosphatase RsbU/P
MTSERPSRLHLPETVRQTLDDISRSLQVDLALWARTGDGDDPEGGESLLYPEGCTDTDRADGEPVRVPLQPREHSSLELEVRGIQGAEPEEVARRIGHLVERSLDAVYEIRFFTFELSERYEEINLLYSIAETLGSTLRLEEAAHVILGEVCDVLGARRGSLWVHVAEEALLRRVASVGEGGMQGPIAVHASGSLTADVFREGHPLITSFRDLGVEPETSGDEPDTVLSVPIRYTPPEGLARTVGVINLIGRRHRHGGPFTASDQKLLAAIASQVGSAIENNRLIQQSLARERMAREMELAHHLQLKLLPALDRFEGAHVAARVEPAEMVGGDFYQVFRLKEGRVGVMIGDVSSHGFPAALIMALSMSAASIHAQEFDAPARVLREVDDSLAEELETTEMYLTLFYGVLDAAAGTLTYANAGHPHAFVVTRDGGADRLLATDPPVGFAGPDAYGEEVHPWDAETDLLFLFTDGLSDTLTTADVPEGEAFVVETVVEHRSKSPRAIIDLLFSLARESLPEVPSDDRTALIVTGS